MRYRMVTFFLLFIFALSLVSFAEDKPEYVGADKCKTCHKAEKNGQQYKIWSESNHAKAYKDLKSKNAAEKLKAAGVTDISDATKAEACLKCHSTAFGKKNISKTFDIEEGVTCEACHGPGSLYKKMNTMKDQKAAVAAGLILPTEETCVPCHGEKAAGHKQEKFDFKKAKATIIHMVPKENDRRK